MKAKRGFTLIELLTVVVIIGILVSIVIGVAGNVRRQGAVSRATAEVSAIELALERYKIENGDYPNATDISIPSGAHGFYDGNPSNYVTASQDLFEDLVGRPRYSETSTDNNPVYFEVKESQVGDPSGTSYFMDPFGYSYGYVYSAADNPRSYYNQVVPDIWSTAGETVTPTGATEHIYLRWVTNWGSR